MEDDRGFAPLALGSVTASSLPVPVSDRPRQVLPRLGSRQMRLEVWVPMAASCAHVLGTLGPYREVIPPSVDLKLPASPSFDSLRAYAQEFAAFRGARDLFSALKVVSAAGHKGPQLAEIVNERLALDEQLQGRKLDRLAGPWLSLWSDALEAYGAVWPAARERLHRSASRLRRKLRDGGGEDAVDRLAGALAG